MVPASVTADTNKTRTKYYLTVNEKILLHLLDHHRFKERREAPRAITQKGIAEGVNIRWNHVPRAMAQLSKMDYVLESISHIEGKTRRQKTYHLTDEGLLTAKNLREKTLGWDVHLKKSDDQIIKMRLSEINSTLKTNFSPLKLLMSISEEGIIEEKELLYGVKEKIPKRKAKTLYAKGEISWPKNFIDRESELATLKDWTEGDEPRTMVIYGSIGIGKSALMAEIIKFYRDRKHILWYEMSENESQYDIFLSLSEFLSEIGKQYLSEYLDENDEINFNEAIRLIDKGLRGEEAILTFDNYFKVSEEVADLFSALCELASKSDSWKIIINAMDTTPFYCRFYHKQEQSKKKIAELTLKGLDMESCRNLLEAPNIDNDALRKIHLMTRGHPLTIELIKLGDVNSLKRIKGFSRQEASLLLYLKGVEST